MLIFTASTRRSCMKSLSVKHLSGFCYRPRKRLITFDFHMQYERAHSSLLRNRAPLVMFPKPEKNYWIHLKCLKKISIFMAIKQRKVKQVRFEHECVDPENVLWETGNSFTGRQEDKDNIGQGLSNISIVILYSVFVFPTEWSGKHRFM